MKAGGGKRKGAAFEREVCRLLSLWVSGNKHADLFWRSAMSGGRATVANRNGTIKVRQAGDITAVAVEGHPFTDMFIAECKHLKSCSIEQAMLSNDGPLVKIWRKLCSDSYKQIKLPLLILKRNNRPTLLLMTFGAVPLLPTHNIRARLFVPPEMMIVTLFDDLLKRACPQRFMISNKRKRA